MQVDDYGVKETIMEKIKIGFFWGNLIDKPIIYVNVFWAYFPKGGMYESGKIKKE